MSDECGAEASHSTGLVTTGGNEDEVVQLTYAMQASAANVPLQAFVAVWQLAGYQTYAESTIKHASYSLVERHLCLLYIYPQIATHSGYFQRYTEGQWYSIKLLQSVCSKMSLF